MGCHDIVCPRTMLYEYTKNFRGALISLPPIMILGVCERHCPSRKSAKCKWVVWQNNQRFWVHYQWNTCQYLVRKWIASWCVSFRSAMQIRNFMKCSVWKCTDFSSTFYGSIHIRFYFIAIQCWIWFPRHHLMEELFHLTGPLNGEMMKMWYLLATSSNRSPSTCSAEPENSTVEQQRLSAWLACDITVCCFDTYTTQYQLFQLNSVQAF